PSGTGTLPGGFTYAAVSAPTITSIIPTCGPTAGGTTVTINGTGLLGAAVTIGGNPATNVFYNAAGTQIIATTPPGFAGPATVTVTTAAGTASLPGAFTYTAPPTLTGISPSQGSTAGGTTVTITGTNLSGAAVTICGNPATNLFYNATGTQIIATTPAGGPGACTVTVTTCGGTASLTGAFTYTTTTQTLTASPACWEVNLPIPLPNLFKTTLRAQVAPPVAGLKVDFYVGNDLVGSAFTDITGTATLHAFLGPLQIIAISYTAVTTVGTSRLQATAPLLPCIPPV
ncbi:IPT/TIG domain-containing protein, partial [Streptomyces kronopolitis]|uniref:IPT/TIG domain-containing protein n=1 Tax=Streptomyces kronopolitis TaxID=1612435 RepID=UPI0020C0F1C6